MPIRMPLQKLAAVTSSAVVIGASVALASCASGPEQATDDSSQKVYRTGSNLPQRDRASDVKTIDPSTLERPIPRPAGLGNRGG